MLCPRRCGADRRAGASGFCGESAALRLSSACLHFGEEPPLTGTGGSGTVFVSGCNLRCAYCQNYQISHDGAGSPVTADEFARICLSLRDAGAENINIVTGSHAVPEIAAGLAAAKKAGLALPVCWNSSAYETPDALRLLDGLIDIWLPDLKTLSPALSEAVFAAEDYPEAAKEAILWALRRSPLRFAGERMLGGVIVRHLFLPGRMDDTVRTLDWLKKHADGRAAVSLMTQYAPVSFADAGGREARLSAFENRPASAAEIGSLRALLDAYRFSAAFYQEAEPSGEWLPDFSRAQPFSYRLAKPVWHWREGFVHQGGIPPRQ